MKETHKKYGRLGMVAHLLTKVENTLTIAEKVQKQLNVNPYTATELHKDIQEIASDWLKWQKAEEKTIYQQELEQLNDIIDNLFVLWDEDNKVTYLSEIRKLLKERRSLATILDEKDDSDSNSSPCQLQILLSPMVIPHFANNEQEVDQHR